MSQPYEPWDTASQPAEPTRRSRGAYIAAAVAAAVLAIAGGTAGYVLGGQGTKRTAGTGDPTASASAHSSGPSSAPPSTATPAVPSGTASSRPPAGSFAVPNVTGKDFVEARRELRELRLGVLVVFGSSGDDRRVQRTEPAAGQPVSPGITVKVYVPGSPPETTVPGLVGLSCDEAGRIAADHGLSPEYPTGRAGQVLRQDPTAPPRSTVRWNDPIRIYCGTASPSPGPSGG